MPLVRENEKARRNVALGIRRRKDRKRIRQNRPCQPGEYTGDNTRRTHFSTRGREAWVSFTKCVFIRAAMTFLNASIASRTVRHRPHKPHTIKRTTQNTKGPPALDPQHLESTKHNAVAHKTATDSENKHTQSKPLKPGAHQTPATVRGTIQTNLARCNNLQRTRALD